MKIHNDFEKFYEQKMGKKLVLFGASKLAEISLSTFLLNSDIYYIVDNDPNKHFTHMVVDDVIVPIYPPERLLNESSDDIVVLVTSVFFNQIAIQLNEYKISHYFWATALLNLLKRSIEISESSDQKFNIQDDIIFRESISYIESDYYRSIADIEMSGFRVYSQDDEDGILQWMISRIDNPVRSFIEFGVQDYTQSNTRYLHLKDGYSGLIIEGDIGYANKIMKDTRLKNNLSFENCFLTASNINSIINKHSLFNQELGVLSIDIDGNDYWIWKAIDNINPQIVICEYNTAFGYEKAVTIPYDESFCWDKKSAYFGASIAALEILARNKGFSMVYANQANVFFIRNDLSNRFNIKTSKELKRKYYWWDLEHLRLHSDKLIYDVKSDISDTISRIYCL